MGDSISYLDSLSRANCAAGISMCKWVAHTGFVCQEKDFSFISYLGLLMEDSIMNKGGFIMRIVLNLNNLACGAIQPSEN